MSQHALVAAEALCEETVEGVALSAIAAVEPGDDPAVHLAIRVPNYVRSSGTEL